MNKDAYAYNSSPQRDPYTLEAPPAPTHRCVCASVRCEDMPCTQIRNPRQQL